MIYNLLVRTGRAVGRLVNFSPDAPSHPHRTGFECLANDFCQQIVCKFSICRKTYVYSRLLATVSFCVQRNIRKIIRALHHVTPMWSGDEKVQLGEDEMGRSRKDKFRYTPSSVHAQMACLTGTDLLKNERIDSLQLHGEHDSPKAKSEGVRLKMKGNYIVQLPWRDER